MPLSAGTRLGPYEIVGLLGAGGMGEVYRAKDPRLTREVAIKVLTASTTADADRLRRFEQEARAAGILNHPNITAVYDIGTENGAPYVVSELLEGETLRSRLGSGPLPVRKALDYAVQLARGLAAAHEKKIVHRDLKPENIFLTRDGRVKILDFGLAKLKETESADGEHTAFPTATEPGVVMGTMGYMSPEQVRGLAADHRSDIFSFGAILHEMLSGQRAFRGDTAADSITAILTKEPPDLSQTNNEVHPGLERIVRHCLEKNREERFESARDLAFDLESLSGLSAPTTGVAAAAAARTVSRRRWLPVAGALIAGLVLGAAGALFAARRLYERQPPQFRQLTFRRGQIQSARFAPDGQTILYTAAWEGRPMEVFTSRLDSPESRPFGLTNAEVLSISPSGEMAVSLNRRNAGAFTATGTLARIGITGGGAPREMLEDVQWADWAPDGKELAIVREVEDRNRLEFPIGKVLYATVGWLSHPRVSRDGREVAVIEHPIRGDDGGFVALFDRTGKKKPLSDHFASAQGLVWSPKGDEVWFTAARVGFNRYVHAATRAGKVRALAEGTGGLTIDDVSADGNALITQSKSRQSLLGKGPSATEEIDLSWLDWSLPAGISQEGARFLFDESGEGGGPGYSVYVRKTDGSPPVRLGPGSAQHISPDGKLVVAIVEASTRPRLVIYPTGAGEPRFLDSGNLSVLAALWHPDGQRLILTGNEPGRGVRLFVQDVGGGKPRAFTPEGYRSGAGISRDGQFVLAAGPDRRRYLYPIAGGEPTPAVGLEQDEMVAGWTTDPDSVYVRRRNELPSRVFRLNLRTGAREPWGTLMPADSAGVTGIGGTNITPDGKAYVYSFLRSLADLYLVEGLR
jgi:Tol biopolymer transport system component